MRKGIRVMGLSLALGLAPAAAAQQQPTSLLTGVNPQAIQFKPIDMSNMVAPPPVPGLQQANSSSLSRFFSNFKLPNFSSIFGSNQPAPAFPGQQPDAFAPVLPTAQLPGQQPNAYGPLLPTTTLPPPAYPNAYGPLLPTTTLPPPGQPDAIHPLLPFTPNS